MKFYECLVSEQYSLQLISAVLNVLEPLLEKRCGDSSIATCDLILDTLCMKRPAVMSVIPLSQPQRRESVGMCEIEMD